MIYKTKRIRRALAYIAEYLYWNANSGVPLVSSNEVSGEDLDDAIDWLREQAQEPKPKAVDVLLREMGAPELFHMEEQ